MQCPSEPHCSSLAHDVAEHRAVQYILHGMLGSMTHTEPAAQSESAVQTLNCGPWQGSASVGKRGSSQTPFAQPAPGRHAVWSAVSAIAPGHSCGGTFELGALLASLSCVLLPPQPSSASPAPNSSAACKRNRLSDAIRVKRLQPSPRCNDAPVSVSVFSRGGGHSSGLREPATLPKTRTRR
jgi:hypothetical protein